jgi:hypothetical protein
VKRILRENGLSIALAAMFVIFIGAQSVAGWLEHNEQQRRDGAATIDYGSYLVSGHFLESVFENWESEFLQMAVYVYLTAILFQKGSSESKKLDEPNEVDEDPRVHRGDPEAPGPVRRGGFLLKLYEHSLGLTFVALFLASFVGHALSGAADYEDEMRLHGQPGSLGDYLTSARFWFESFQNWQSEFLAMLAIVVLSVFLRQRGSPESKPVAAPHGETGD